MKKTTAKKLCALTLSLILALSVFFSVSVSAGNLDPNSDARAVSLEVAAEGAVLLENDGVLPLAGDAKVAVFGRSQHTFIKGGGGSGTVYTTESYNFVEGMAAAGINYDKDLYKTYSDWCIANPQTGSRSNPEMPIDGLDFKALAEKNDVAVVIYARNSSEGSDRTAVKGDWYLSDDEDALLAAVSAEFDNVIVILNTGCTMDISWIDKYDVDAVLEAWQPGGYGSFSIAQILNGTVNPSGKLMDTWAKTYEAYPASQFGTFGTTSKSVDGDRYVDPIYSDDIYVGYRYFETFAPEAVQYEFAYGLSYTTFDYTITRSSVSNGNVSATVRVTNTGEVAGKEVVQLYFTAPQGALGKAKYEMGTFAKTNLLQPGQSQTITLTFPVNDMASYDDSGITGHENCYVLEAGTYQIYAGTSVRNIKPATTYRVNELTVVQELSEILAPTYAFNVIKPAEKEDGTFEVTQVPVALRHEDNKVSDKWDTDLPAIELTGIDRGIDLGHVADGYYTMDEFMGQFSVASLVQIFGGIYGVRQDNYHYFPDTAGGAAGGIGHTLGDYGVNFSVFADGPAGLRLTIKEGQTGNTYFPMATMQACTWNTELLYRVGVEIGKEMILNEVKCWLAPAVNIHRDPLCGRNFEYYSEDPVLAGKGAGALIRGLQSQGAAACIKHYAANNQERDRMGGNSIVSERALRELYLKSFENVIKEGNPWSVMTAYNQINGSFTATNYELCTTILREEWGWNGAVMTDWQSGKDNGNASMIRAQNDLCMPSLVGRGDPSLPSGFSSRGATNSWYGTVHAGQVYCQYCGTEYGDYELYKINNMWLPVDGPCVDADGHVVEGCTRPYETYVAPSLPEGYTQDGEFVYDADGNVLVDYTSWVNDRTGLVTGFVDGDVSLGELERSARNVFEFLIKIGGYNEVDGQLAIANAPESVKINEVFSFTIVERQDVLAVKLLNEKGAPITILDYDIEDVGDYRVFTVSTKIGTPGDRVISVQTKDISKEWKDSGVALNIEVTDPVVINSAAFSEKTVAKNTPFELNVNTTPNAVSINVVNEKGLKMGKTLVAKTVNDDSIDWKYEMKIGTAGMGRIFDVTAANRFGGTATESISINVK